MLLDLITIYCVIELQAIAKGGNNMIYLPKLSQ
jgi:hypothetical protein